MAGSQPRKLRYMAQDMTWFYMEDAKEAYKEKKLDTFGYMYELNKTEKESVDLFRQERSTNQILNETCKIAERELGTTEVYKVVKRAYTMEEPALYRIFNAETRGLLSFFDWKKFNFKGMWLLLYKALMKEDFQVPTHVYRGCGIPFRAKIGSIIKFKQFTSTSADRTVVESFIDLPQHSTIFDIKITTGLPLADCSEYDFEQEVLIRPHDGLEVIKVEKERNGMTNIFLEQKISLLF